MPPEEDRTHGPVPSGGDGSCRHAMPILKVSRRASSSRLPTSIAMPGLGVGGLILTCPQHNAVMHCLAKFKAGTNDTGKFYRQPTNFQHPCHVFGSDLPSACTQRVCFPGVDGNPS